MLGYLRLVHLLFNFIWVGNLLALTRLMGYHVKQEGTIQLTMAKIYRRMHLFIGLPCMTLSIILALYLMTIADLGENKGWFVLKLHFVAGLVGCQFVCGHFLDEMQTEVCEGRGVKYKILHGVTGLLLIGILATIYLFHRYS